MKSLLRVAAGPRLGYGHLMRARALADALPGDVAVSLRGGPAARRAAEAMGCRIARGARLASDVDLLIVDDPNHEDGRAWVARARRANVRCASVHDGMAAHAADLVVAPGIDAPRPRVARAVLHGPRFYLLDRRVPELAASRSARLAAAPPRVLVALGGGRHVLPVAQPLVDELRRLRPDLDVVVAPGFSNLRPALRGASWLPAQSGLAAALVESDVAIVAGGVTLYEACALGVPAVGLAVVRGQRRAIRAFARRGAIVDAGAGVGTRASMARTAREVDRLLANDRLRAAVSARARRLVDGHGVERVAARLLALVSKGGHAHA